MDSLELAVISRWFHIVSVAILVGGSFFMRFVLMPAAKELPTDQHDLLRERLFKRWKRFVHTALLFLIVSGIYNLILAIQLHRKDYTYHGLLMVKLLLAFGVIFLAIALTAKGAWSEKLRRSNKLWLSINLLLAMSVIAVSSYMKVRPIPQKALDAMQSADTKAATPAEKQP